MPTAAFVSLMLFRSSHMGMPKDRAARDRSCTGSDPYFRILKRTKIEYESFLFFLSGLAPHSGITIPLEFCSVNKLVL